MPKSQVWRCPTCGYRLADGIKKALDPHKLCSQCDISAIVEYAKERPEHDAHNSR